MPTIAQADGFGFMTPSGNIYCNGAVTIGGLDCVIVNRQGPPALPRPPSCNQYWGHEFSIKDTGRVEMRCGPRPSSPGYTDIAPYGVSGQFGSVNCLSEKTGFSCTNASGNGFFLSRRSQYLIGNNQAPQVQSQAPAPEQGQTADVGRPPVWRSEFGQGILDANVGDGNGNYLEVVCNLTGLDTIASRVSLESYDPKKPVPFYVPAGSTVEFLFDGKHSAPIVFNDHDRFVVENNAVSKGTFTFLINRIRQHKFVIVKLPDGRQFNFPLKGSSKELFKCPATPSVRPFEVTEVKNPAPSNDDGRLVVDQPKVQVGEPAPASQPSQQASVVLSDEQLVAMDRKAEAIRQDLIANPAYLVALMGRRVDPEQLFTLIDQKTVSRFIAPAIALPGCMDEKGSVVGFYNAFQHLWLVVEMDDDGRVLDARMAPGFSPVELPEQLAWYDLIDESSSVLKAIQGSASVQVLSFLDLFSGENCAGGLERVAAAFSDKEAVAQIQVNEEEFARVPAGVIEQITRLTEERQNIGESSQLLSFGYVGVAGETGGDLLTVHTSSLDRSLLFIQTWDTADGGIDRIEGVLGLLTGSSEE